MSALPACCVRHKCASLTLSVVLATLLLAVSIGAPIFLTRLLRAGIRDSIALTPLAQRDATKAWQSWSDSRNAEARPLTMSAHLFNVTNPLEAAGGAPIVLREIGPFVFNEFKIRSNFSWGSATTSSGASVSTLSYTEQVYYLFDRAHTPAALSLDTLITAPNLPFITALTLGPDVAILLGYDCFDTPEAPFAKSSRCLFRSRRAVDLIFGFTPTDESLPWIGLLKNDTTSPLPSTIITGYDSASGELDANAAAQFRHFTAWEGSSQSLAPVSPLTARDHSTWRPPWNTTAANRVGGSEGIQNAPSLDLSAPLSVYTHPLFRQMTLEASPAPPFLLQHRPTSSDPCAEPVDPTPAAFTYEGIDLSHFQLAASVFQNASANPANMAYFAFGVPSGILNTTKCFAGLQLFVSPPHFLNVDHTPLTQRVHGLAPSVQEHSTYLGIEPISGATMLARKRLQFSVLLQSQAWPDPLNASVTLSWFSALQPILTPIVWFQESGQITADKAALFVSTVYVARSARLWVPIICGVLFLVALGFAIALASDRTSVDAPEDGPAFRRPLDVSVAETSKRPLLVNHF